ncbi:carboxylesterase [Lutibacter sp.]|uniref:alpha/beta hydrolase n=1 Tax=Lutibacter sp. TaxID=1925666 RepID=UPI002736EFBC|nr:alpha/beta hydrolase [Lutibacter sp.]MDP3312223.1 alpha/beta hydrolase [Lutibacter sp.]
MNIKLTLILTFISTFAVAQEKYYSETELSIPTNSVTINGTLLTPNFVKKSVLLILIPGSGPTDRNGNSSLTKNNSLKFLAEGLAENNIATYRFDKSVLSYTKDNKEKIDYLTFDIFIEEIKTVIQHFKMATTYSKIIVAGHSQGSLVGMIASTTDVDGFISIAGAGRTIDEILVEQISKQAPFLKDETVRIITELKKGNTVDEFNPMLISIFNKSVQPFLISWMKYNPQEELKKLRIPILIINGTNDIQVSVTDAELLHAAKSTSQLQLIENMNHIFKEIKGDLNENMQSYYNPDLPIMDELTSTILKFISEIRI